MKAHRAQRKLGIRKEHARKVPNDKLLVELRNADAKAKQPDTYDVEQASVDLLRRMQGLTVRHWQDGTESDVGIRPTHNLDDRWLPLQIKASSNASGRFRLKARGTGKLPSCDLICVVLEPPTFYFFPREDLDRNFCTQSMICTSKVMRDHVGLNADALELMLLDRYTKDHLLSDEETLRWQVHWKHGLELWNIKLSNRLLPNSVVAWPERPMMVYDLVRDGQNEQYKTVTKAGATFTCHLHKLLAGQFVAYEVGDNDWYIFGYVDHAAKLYLQWRIPESFLFEKGMLSQRGDDDVFVFPGARSLSLFVDHPIVSDRLGITKPPRKDADRSTEDFLTVVLL